MSSKFLRDGKKSGSFSWSVVLIAGLAGGLADHYFIEPTYGKFFGKKNEHSAKQQEYEKLRKIEKEIDRYSHELFEDYFGSDADEKYEEYYQLNNHANQLNPNNDAYWQSRGYDERPDDWEDRTAEGNNDYSQDELDNHADQMNPNNDAYWQSRGEDERPEDWEDRSIK